MKTIGSLADWSALAGQDVGESAWFEVTQDQVTRFADATGDHQWIHVDPARAKDTPFGGTIAHGYLTLSLAPKLLREVLKIEGFRMAINYGLNKVRFPAPVLVGARVRLRAHAAAVETIDAGAGVQVTMKLTTEVEGQEKPACVAEALFRYYL